MQKSKVGEFAENQAMSHLESLGLKLVERNFSCHCGEIDLIMSEAINILAFIEVRYRSASSFGNSFDSVTFNKQKKLRKTAAFFLQTHREFRHHYCRFDVIGIDKQLGPNHIQWVPNAFY